MLDHITRCAEYLERIDLIPSLDYDDGLRVAREESENLEAPTLIALSDNPEFWDGWHAIRPDTLKMADPTRGIVYPLIERPAAARECPTPIHDLQITDRRGRQVLHTAVAPTQGAALRATAIAVRKELELDYGDIDAGTLRLISPAGRCASLPLTRTRARKDPALYTLCVPFLRPGERPRSIDRPTLPDIRITRHGSATLATVLTMRAGQAHYVGQLHRLSPGRPWIFDGDLKVAHPSRAVASRAIREAIDAEHMPVDLASLSH